MSELCVTANSESKAVFLSWIPCVTGHLGFDRFDVAMGETELPPKNKIVAMPDGSLSGHLRLASKHDWTDFERTDSDGVFYSLLTGVYTVNGDVLRGQVLFVPFDRKSDWDAIKVIANAAFIENSTGLQCLRGCEKIEVESKNLIANPQIGAWVAEFTLKTTGLIELSILGKTDPDESLTAAQWSYYYVKYAFHKHQHHLHGVDSLVTAYPCNDKAGKLILADLKLAVTDIKRHSEATPGVRLSKREGKDLQRAAGIAAYAKSLVEVLRLDAHIDEATAKSELLFIDNAIKSIEKRTEEIKLDYESGADTRSLITWIATGIAPAAFLVWSQINAQTGGLPLTSLRDVIAFSWAVMIVTALAHTYLSVVPSKQKTKAHLKTLVAGVAGLFAIRVIFSFFA